MKKLRKYLGLTAWVAAIALLVFACTDDVDIHTAYSFDLETMPVQKRIMEDETAEIRCTLVREGNYQEARYFIRYFQPDGTGELRLDDGTLLTPNDLFPLTKEVFRMYYTSRCSAQQVIDVYIQDNQGQTIQKSFAFQDASGKDKEEPDGE